MSPIFASQRFSTVQEFLGACAPALLASRSTQANLALSSSYSIAQEDNVSIPLENPHWWLAVSLSEDSADRVFAPLFVIIVVKSYPGVLACSHDPKDLSEEVVRGAMQALIDAATDIPTSRLSSIFGPKALSVLFADIWASSRDLKRMERPLLHAYQTFVTKETLRPSFRPRPENVIVGRVSIDELNVAADMFVKFTQDLPHKWDLETATKYAKEIIESGGLYGARVNDNLKAIAAAMRPTPGVKAISQVFTYEDARGRGLAELIVREACERTLEEPGIKAICLFIEPHNHAAMRVYGRVGFIGLDTGVPDDQTEEWEEVGFESVELLKF